RNFVYPQYVLDSTAKNATSCKGADKELKLEGCYGGLPFPIPKTGNQVMWNHLLAYEQNAAAGVNETYIVPAAGKPVFVGKSASKQYRPFLDPEKAGPFPSELVFWKTYIEDLAPARAVGGKLVIIDSLDMLKTGRRAFSYIPGQRRVKLSPDLQYDTPHPYSGGAGTMDDAKIFLGALDRFDFKLIGKKEKYIYYNNFNLNDAKACSTETLLSTKGFPHPDCVRWELHRVWVVEATLKPGFRHIYKKRIFYWDEDSYAAGQAENYDAGGKLFRFVFGSFFPYFDGPGGNGDSTHYLDLQTGIYSVSGSGSCKACGWWSIKKEAIDPMLFSPEAMAGAGIR
ncbi:DUF1329 domain-containing protein, partial [Massilia cavernae]